MGGKVRDDTPYIFLTVTIGWLVRGFEVHRLPRVFPYGTRSVYHTPTARYYFRGRGGGLGGEGRGSFGGEIRKGGGTRNQQTSHQINSFLKID